MTIEHREVLELLPWYVNGTLAAGERVELERHLNECLPCNAALKQERQLRDLVQSRESARFGPEHGFRDLSRQVDRSEGRRGWSIGLPALGYAMAATFGGALVWAFIVFSDGSGHAAVEFSTLSAGSATATERIDIVFFDQPAPAELNEYLNDLGGVLISGPSSLGRYTIAIQTGSRSTVEGMLTRLQSDPRIRFAGRSFQGDSSETGEGP